MTRMFIATLAALAVCSGQGLADDLPRGLGHPTDGSHWYTRDCCDQRDCEQLEPGAITRTENGLVIRYRSARGHVAEGFLQWGATGIRASQDGHEHGCSYSSGRVPCVYIPPET